MQSKTHQGSLSTTQTGQKRHLWFQGRGSATIESARGNNVQPERRQCSREMISHICKAINLQSQSQTFVTIGQSTPVWAEEWVWARGS